MLDNDGSGLYVRDLRDPSLCNNNKRALNNIIICKQNMFACP